MSASFIVPFNNDPSASTFITQSDYTVPAGKYAHIEYIINSGKLYLDSVIHDSGATSIQSPYYLPTFPSTSAFHGVVALGVSLAAGGSLATVSTNFQRYTTTAWITATAVQEGHVSFGAFNGNASNTTHYARHSRGADKLSDGGKIVTAASDSGIICDFFIKSGDTIGRYSSNPTGYPYLFPTPRTGTGSIWLKAGQALTVTNWETVTIGDTIGKDFKIRVTEYNSIS